METLPTSEPESLDSLTDRYESLLSAYQETFTAFEAEGTRELGEKLTSLQSEITALEATINAILGPLGYDLDKTPRTAESHEAINQRLKEAGSFAVLDESFGEQGIVSIDIDPKTMEALKTYDTAIAAYTAADNNSPSCVLEELKDMPLTSLEDSSFDAYVLSYNADQETRQSSDAIVADMDKAGFRPATFTELLALCITHPDLGKRNVYLVALGTKATLDGHSSVALLNWGGSQRLLDRGGWTLGWSERRRFVCVRK